MTTIAASLGITWDQPSTPSTYRLTRHAKDQARLKGWSEAQILRVAENPLHTYPSLRVPGQARHIRDNIVAVVDPSTHKVVTVYADRVETDLRHDQTDRDSLQYGANHRKR
jgi:3-deoxy-D-arabino-heptulosonate 7-phosphate (DAHP) synthase class II